jgi:hypothetical protein
MKICKLIWYFSTHSESQLLQIVHCRKLLEPRDNTRIQSMITGHTIFTDPRMPWNQWIVDNKYKIVCNLKLISRPKIMLNRELYKQALNHKDE